MKFIEHQQPNNQVVEYDFDKTQSTSTQPSSIKESNCSGSTIENSNNTEHLNYIPSEDFEDDVEYYNSDMQEKDHGDNDELEIKHIIIKK
jgi:hypothetical protein